MKHTNSKVIITLYVYNVEKISLKKEYKNLYNFMYSPKTNPNGPLGFIKGEGGYFKDKEGNINIIYDRPFNLKKLFGEGIGQLHRPSNATIVEDAFPASVKLQQLQFFSPSEKKIREQVDGFNLITSDEIYYSVTTSLVNKWTTYYEDILKYYEYLTKLVKIKVLNDYEKLLIFTNKASNFYTYEYPENSPARTRTKLMEVAFDNYWKKLDRLRYLLKFNEVKFEKPFIGRLKRMVEKLYNKEVEFNIVNLKKMHLNSDIFTQAIVLKLKNKKSNLMGVLNTSLRNIKLPYVSRLSYKKHSKPNHNEYFVNQIRNAYINDMFNNDITKIDSLNKLLLNLFKKSSTINHPISGNLKNYVIRYLKHLNVSGVRIEAKGRLTKRFTASRSVFKFRSKGSLRNVDSSFKGLSTVMLRGHAKSNVQYSMLKSKNRGGAFGIKG